MYDCIVCGAGPSGICASIALAKQNKKVLLIEETGMLGGTNTLSLVGPLMTFHNESTKVIGGIASDIVDRLIAKKECLGYIKDPFDFCSTITPFSIEALKALYFELIEEYKIDLLLHTKVIDVKKENTKIKSITICNSDGINNISAQMYIDATGNADVCYKAKINYQMGRINDSLCQPLTMPFIVGNVDFEKIKDAIYKDPSNFDKAKDYDYKYVGVSGFFKEVKQGKANGDFEINRDRVLLFQGVRKDEAIINTTRVLKYNGTIAKERTQAEIEGRKQIQIVFNFLKKYIPGFENSYISMTPVQIGIRETRHIECDYMMTKEDIFSHNTFFDSITVGAYPMDIHSPVGDKLEVTDDRLTNLIYEIPLRSIMPKNIDNLIVTGRSIGATHEAAASLRVTPIVMALGEASGVLASLAIDNESNIRKVSYKDVQDILIKNKAYPSIDKTK